MFLAHTFLAYFVGVSELAHWVTRSPLEHPVAFLVMAGTTALMMLDFGVIREQICMVACPYGRLQSVLLDRRSLIVAYDDRRGEPRGHLPRGRLAAATARPAGDCIDCGACVDLLSHRHRHPRRARRWSASTARSAWTRATRSWTASAGRAASSATARATSSAAQPRRMLRPRVVIYPLLLAVVWGALAYALLHRAPADVTVLRGIGSPFTVTPSGMVMNQIRVKIVNRDAVDRRYQVELVEPAGAPATARARRPGEPAAGARGQVGDRPVLRHRAARRLRRGTPRGGAPRRQRGGLEHGDAVPAARPG